LVLDYSSAQREKHLPPFQTVGELFRWNLKGVVPSLEQFFRAAAVIRAGGLVLAPSARHICRNAPRKEFSAPSGRQTLRTATMPLLHGAGNFIDLGFYKYFSPPGFFMRYSAFVILPSPHGPAIPQ
jgi:hypothetical protein